MLGIAAAAVIGFMFLRKPYPHKRMVMDENNVMTEAVVVIQEQKFTTRELLTKILKLTINKRMRLLLPELIWTGISIAYFSGILVSMMSLCLAEVGDTTQ